MRLPAFGELLIILWAAVVLSGCQSINRTREQADIPPGMVLFSFDDGPNPNGTTTARLLDILGKYQVLGVFALLGENAERCPDLVRRIREEGHLIVNHGYSDKWAVFLGREEFHANLLQGEEALRSALGEIPKPKLYRPQGGFYTKAQESLWQKEGYALVPGTARAFDAVLSKGDEERIIRRLMEVIEEQKGGIILLHDGRDSLDTQAAHHHAGAFDRSWLPDLVERLILLLLEKGYQPLGRN
jgi:peptidoglycan/xylan/chitin deacetylase (PgdA/CDA1 family)